MLRDDSPRNTPPPGDPSRGVVYLRIVLCPEESSRLWVFLNISFNREGLLTPRPTHKLEDYPSSAVRYCLFNLFPATLLIHPLKSWCVLCLENMVHTIRLYPTLYKHNCKFCVKYFFLESGIYTCCEKLEKNHQNQRCKCHLTPYSLSHRAE